MNDLHPVKQPIVAIDIDGNTAEFAGYDVGRSGVTRIEACSKAGLHCDIPYIRVWEGDLCRAEFCQHNIVGVYFTTEADIQERLAKQDQSK